MILIQNIYYMLCYAFKVLKQQCYKNIETETFETASELLAEILIVGIQIEIKRGLFKNYENKTETITSIRGKINLNETIKKQTLIKNEITCDFDAFTTNTYLNQVLKTTLNLLLQTNNF